MSTESADRAVTRFVFWWAAVAISCVCAWAAFKSGPDVFLWERTLGAQSSGIPWVKEAGPFRDYAECVAFAAEHPRDTFGRHCGTESDMGGAQ